MQEVEYYKVESCRQGNDIVLFDTCKSRIMKLQVLQREGVLNLLNDFYIGDLGQIELYDKLRELATKNMIVLELLVELVNFLLHTGNCTEDDLEHLDIIDKSDDSEQQEQQQSEIEEIKEIEEIEEEEEKRWFTRSKRRTNTTTTNCYGNKSWPYTSTNAKHNKQTKTQKKSKNPKIQNPKNVERSLPDKWTSKEDQKITDLVARYGDSKWKVISRHLKTKTPAQCGQHWRRVLNPKINKQKWSEEEDCRLFNAVKKHGENKWSLVARDVVSRTDIQCRYRYLSRK